MNVNIDHSRKYGVATQVDDDRPSGIIFFANQDNFPSLNNNYYIAYWFASAANECFAEDGSLLHNTLFESDEEWIIKSVGKIRFRLVIWSRSQLHKDKPDID